MARNLSKQLQNGLVLWVDGTSNGTTYYDLSGTGNGTATASITKGRRLQNQFFKGAADSQYIDLNRKVFGGVSTYSICLWYYADSVSVTQQLVYESQAGAANLQMRLDSAALNFYYGAGNHSWNPSISLTTGRWYHIAFTASLGGSSTAKVYLDGVLKNTETGAIASVNNSNLLSLAGDRYGVYTNQSIRGSMANVMIYNREISAKEVELHRISTFIK